MNLAPAAVRRATLALVLGVTAAGCVSLPDSSSVSAGSGAGVSEQPNPIRNSPRGPVIGATRQEIADGYLQAMLAFPRAPDLVRQFMSPAAGDAWQPEAQTLFYESRNIAQGKAGSVALQVQALGSIDSRGSWASADPSNDILDMRFDFQRVGGQWRIGNPPTGTLLDADFFERYYQQFSLYFFDPAHTLLTPDPVFLLLGDTSQTATDLVRDLLLGPTGSMAGVVAAEAPLTTRVDPRVRVTASGLAEVPLTRQILALTPTDLKRFAAQLTWTLRQERLGINHVRMTSAGQVIRIPGQGDVLSVDAFAGYDPTIFAASRRLYALSDGHLVAVTSSRPSVVAGKIGSLARKATYAAIDPTLARAALVTNNATRVVVGGISAGVDTPGNELWFDGAQNLRKPSWDVHGLLWLVDQTSEDGAVVRVVTASTARVVDAPGISGYDVEAFAVSRDGSRLAAVIGHGPSTRIVIAMIDRSATSRINVSIPESRVIVNAQFPLASLTQLAWFSSTSVAVLAQDEGSNTQPYEVAIDGSRVQPTTGFLTFRPISLAAAANIEVPEIIGTAEGRLFTRTPDQQWAQLTARNELFAPVYAG